MRKKKIIIPIYPVNFTIIEFETDDELQKMFNDVHFLQEINSFNGGVFEYKEHLYVCFRKINEDGKSYPTPGIIVHESKHLVNEVFNRVGAELDLNNDEPEAYLLQWVFEEIETFFK